MPEGGLSALIFDVDGTLAETEEAHRQSFNRAFAEAGLADRWDQKLYIELLQVTGGQPRMVHYFKQKGADDDVRLREQVKALHAAKNRFYAEAVEAGEVALRPGVAALIGAAHAAGLRLAIATTTSRVNIEALLASAAAQLPTAWFDAIVTGEDVRALKPDPEVYLVALARLGVAAEHAVAFEDSGPGLLAAKAAGIRTVVTPGIYTGGHDFTGADWLLPDLSGLSLTTLQSASV